MSKLQTMVELTEKHVPQDSTCVRGRNLTLGSARLYTLGVFLAVGVFCKEYSALGQCLFHFIQQVAKQGGIITFPIYGDRVLSLGKKKEQRNQSVPLLRGDNFIYSQAQGLGSTSEACTGSEQAQLRGHLGNSSGKPPALLLPTGYVLSNREPTGSYECGSSAVQTAPWAR